MLTILYEEMVGSKKNRQVDDINKMVPNFASEWHQNKCAATLYN